MSKSIDTALNKTPQTELLDLVLRDFNAHDAARFASHFADDARLYQHPGTITQNGRAELIAYYLTRFEEVPNIKAQLLHRIVIGDYVIDHERIQRSPDAEPVEVLAINFVKERKIQRLDMIRDSSPPPSAQKQASQTTETPERYAATPFPITLSTKIVDSLVDAYNAHDAHKFAGHFAEDANAYEHPGALAQKGRAGIEAHYTRRFAELPELTTRVLRRIVLGEYVIDHERVQRAHDQMPFDTLAINHVREGKVQRLDIVR